MIYLMIILKQIRTYFWYLKQKVKYKFIFVSSFEPKKIFFCTYVVLHPVTSLESISTYLVALPCFCYLPIIRYMNIHKCKQNTGIKVFTVWMLEAHKCHFFLLFVALLFALLFSPSFFPSPPFFHSPFFCPSLLPFILFFLFTLLSFYFPPHPVCFRCIFLIPYVLLFLSPLYYHIIKLLYPLLFSFIIFFKGATAS